MEYLLLFITVHLIGILHAVAPGLRCRHIDANPQTTLCCNGIVYLRSGENPACCGYVGYDMVDSICCGNRVLPRRGLVTECCGDKAYDASKDICLNGIVRQPEWAPQRPKDSSYDSRGIVRKSGFRPACCWIRNRNVRGDCCATIKQRTGMLPACCDSPGLRPVCCLDIYSSLVCCNKRHPTCCPDTPDPDRARRLAESSFALPTAQVDLNRPNERTPHQRNYQYYTRTVPPTTGSQYHTRTLPWPLVDEVPTDSYGRKIHMNGQSGPNRYEVDNDANGYISRKSPEPTPYNGNLYTTSASNQYTLRVYNPDNGDNSESARYNRYENRLEDPYSSTTNRQYQRVYPVDMDGSGDERIPAGGVPVVNPSRSWYNSVQGDGSYVTKRILADPTKKPRTTEAVKWRPSCCLSVKIQICCTMIKWRTGVTPDCCEAGRITTPPVRAKNDCQLQAFNQRSHVCCEGKLRRRIGIRPACCGQVAYDALVFQCCNKTVRRSCKRTYKPKKSVWPGYYVK